MTDTVPRSVSPRPVSPRPVPYDPELEPGLAAFFALVEPVPLRAETIPFIREHFAGFIPSMQDQAVGHRVRWWNAVAPGPAGAPDVEVTVVAPVEPVDGAPGVLGIHGGGMVLGTRFFGTGQLIDLAERFGAVGVAVEYRLAPEHPGPAAAEDCYAGLLWFAEHAGELGVDPGRIVVAGSSAGGGLSAAVSLMARDRRGPALAGQLLDAPMIDDRNDTTSSHQYDGIGAWDRHNNDAAWTAVLGERRFTDRAPAYAAPARARDLSGLPPAYVEVGAAEVFRDEAVDYASRIWATGGDAELHVWAGGYHGFSSSSPEAAVSRAANAARDSWLRRIWGRRAEGL
jgi:acetyl esterase/lipase